MSDAQLMTAILILPLLVMVGVLAAGSRPNLRESVSIVGGVILFGLVYHLYSGMPWESAQTLILAEPLPGIQIAFTPEPLGLLFALVASLRKKTG